MASRNPENISGSPFHARKPPSGQTSNQPRWSPSPPPKHKAGLKVSLKDNAPEFHAECLPPGSAPREHTYEPAVGPERKYGADYNNPEEALGMPGMTSADADKSMGHPVHGETSWELHHGGRHGHPPKKGREGLAKYGAVGDLNAADTRMDPKQRALEKDVTLRHHERIHDPPAEERPSEVL